MLHLDGQVHHDTHVFPKGNYVSVVGKYLSVSPSQRGNYVSADSWGSNPFFGAYAVLDAGLFVPVGVVTALIIPRRRRHSAQNYLATAAPKSPGSPPAWAGRPDKLGGNLPPG